MNENKKTAEEKQVEAEVTKEVMEKKKVGTRVYCGPTIRNVAKQYTAYKGELPEALEKFVEEHPTAAGLIVPVDRFAETRMNVETPKTAENIIFKKIQSEM